MEKRDLNSLAMEARRNGRAFRTLLESSETLIDKAVSRYAKGINAGHRDEYFSEAIQALYKAVEDYEEGKGSFSSYAYSCMGHAILDYMRNNQSLMNIGTTKLNEIRKLNEARAAIKEDGLEENEETLMAYSGIASRKTLETVKWAERVNGTLSLDNSAKDNGSTFLDLFEDDWSFEDDFYRDEEIRSLYRAVSNLSREEKIIVAKAYGLYGTDMLTNKEMASLLHVSENTIVNKKKAIRAKLKVMMESWAA